MVERGELEQSSRFARIATHFATYCRFVQHKNYPIDKKYPLIFVSIADKTKTAHTWISVRGFCVLLPIITTLHLSIRKR